MDDKSIRATHFDESEEHEDERKVMKRAKLSWIDTWTLAVVVILLVSLARTTEGQGPGNQKPGEWKAVAADG
jgi:hypothetical protein